MGLGRIVTQAGQVLSLVGAALKNSYTNGTVFSLQGTDEIEFPVAAAFDGATVLTSIEFQVVISDDLVKFDPVASQLVSQGESDSLTVAAEHSFKATGGAQRDRLVTRLHRRAKYACLQSKCTGAATGSGTDGATGSLNFSE